MSAAAEDKATPATGPKGHPTFEVWRPRTLYEQSGIEVDTGAEHQGPAVECRVSLGMHTAPGRKAAIRMAVAGLPEAEQYGDFYTVLDGAMVKDTRGRKIEPVDVWS